MWRCEVRRQRVHPYPLPVVGHARRLQAQVLGVGDPAGGHEQRLRLQRVQAPFSGLQLHADAPAVAGDPARAGPGHHAHAVGLQPAAHGLRRVLVLLLEDAARHFDERHLHPEPREGLAQLAPDGAAAEHDHPLRPLAQLVEDGLVRVRRRPRQALDGRDRGPAARRDHEVACAQAPLAGLDLARGQEPRLGADDVHPQGLEALLRVVGGDPGATLAHALEDAQEVEARLERVQAPLGGPADLRDQPGRGEEGLAGDAARVEAVPAHAPSLHERHPAAERGRGRGGDEAGGAPADHDHVVGAAVGAATLGRGHLHAPGPSKPKATSIPARHPVCRVCRGGGAGGVT